MSISIGFLTHRPDMMHTRTAKDWYAFLGARPENLGVAAKLYPKYTSSYFTEAFGNVMYHDQKKSKFRPIESMEFRWEIQSNEIRRIAFAEDVKDVFGQTHGLEIPMVFREKYYGVNDTFLIDATKQVCIVIEEPIRKADDWFEYTVRLMDGDHQATLDVEGCKAGMTTRWLGNVQPEFSEIGNVKYTSNWEMMRGYIGQIRCDIEYSERYLALEDNFLKVSQEKDNGHRSDYLFKMPGRKKLLLDNWMEARNNGLLWQKSTMDENGKCVIQDRRGRDLVAGDGLIVQYMRYASKYNYAKLSLNVLTEAMNALSMKCDEPTGNVWSFVCNQKVFTDLQSTLAVFLQTNKVDNQKLYSSFENKYIKVGGTYMAFEWAGNVISLHVDPALTNEFPDYGFAILVDLGTDKATGLAQHQMFTLRDRAFIDNTISGVGVRRGEVATAVAGGKEVISGYAGIGSMNPYKAYVLIQNH